MPVDSHDNQCRMGYTVREDMWTDMIHDVACTLGSQNVNPGGQDILLSIIQLEGQLQCLVAAL